MAKDAPVRTHMTAHDRRRHECGLKIKLKRVIVRQIVALGGDPIWVIGCHQKREIPRDNIHMSFFLSHVIIWTLTPSLWGKSRRDDVELSKPNNPHCSLLAIIPRFALTGFSIKPTPKYPQFCDSHILTFTEILTQKILFFQFTFLSGI